MYYKTQLLKEHSKANTNLIAKQIGNNAEEFNKIIEIIYNQEAPLPQRAAWLLATVNQKHPALLTPYIPQFIETIQKFKIDGIKRHILLVLASQVIPQPLQAKLIDICFEFILSPSEAVAVKVHAMQIIANLAKQYPPLKGELKSVINQQLPKSTAAFSARAKRILKEME